MNTLKATFLGTGTSQGIPVITCDCAVCQSTNQKDKRLRTSLMISNGNQNLVIDTGPDFRQQMLRENVQSIEAILFTHDHKDHVAGMDDIRAFNFKTKKAMEVYADANVQETLKRDYHYVFAKDKYPGVPSVNLNDLTNEPIEIMGEKIIPLNVLHHKLPIKAFRIRNFAYITDAKSIPPAEYEKLAGVKELVLNALRKEPHISHFTLAEALKIIEDIKPEKAFLTHISHLMGIHDEVNKELPDNVFLAHDGLQVEFD
ncbi:MBL fold metallo-hydrolase [Crocinitomix catalasitica]|nr:MBL fold metallo-hydrolase [Crocinitomix catalasitica]